MKLLKTYLSDFFALIFPEVCAACDGTLLSGEQILCTDCRYNLPYTNFHLQPDNIVARQFWGKINIKGAYALFYFTKGGKVQQMVHRLKYDGIQKVGVLTGTIAGEQLSNNNIFKTVDYIIPVPLHKSKLRKRGFNQSTCFANGLSVKLNAPVEEHNLIRTVATETQTKKSRFSRFRNMQQVFAVADPDKLQGKHILLVDDIVTTGSTLEACGVELLKIPGVKLSIVTIAYAE
ncbi:ComF family protein [Mucilaginibacter limnophilus]|uniref:ComF family protein n=1 Tax=Mucilaginibacter limnophilus TaxID=1932778 RepID=A0A3S2V9D2_9SPHI|nr:phosphoribosyltransferase family protein [Mucilaginibacter limnophilus]RVU01891.1 ComF family protein [Mucilaginibacter limnophilus]